MKYYNALTISRIRKQFKSTLDLNTALYENKVNQKFNQKQADDFIRRMNINKENYIFYNHIDWMYYRKALNYYNNTIIKQPNTDDIRRTLIIFFPYLLKSMKLDDRLIPCKDQFKYDNGKIGAEIIGFIDNYRQLEERGILLHRREMSFYLEAFLNMLTASEEKLIAEEDKKSFLYYHYFRPYLRPELYWVDLNEKDIDKQGD
jgi:hypothetical protein